MSVRGWEVGGAETAALHPGWAFNQISARHQVWPCFLVLLNFSYTVIPKEEEKRKKPCHRAEGAGGGGGKSR